MKQSHTEKNERCKFYFPVVSEKWECATVINMDESLCASNTCLAW